MNAFHSFWSYPNIIRHNGSIVFPDYEQLTAILSALEWQKHNGSISMLTDSRGKAFFEEIGINKAWNEIVPVLDDLPEDIDPFLFWAAGKLAALKTMPSPCVMLDTDLIIWDCIEDTVSRYDITAAHSESLNPDVYPEPDFFRFDNDYAFPESWDFSLKAANTAFLCIRDEEFKDSYIRAARDFAENVNSDGLDPVKAMCFAEQRLLPVCAKAEGRSLGFLLSLEYAEEQELVTHTWGFKQALEHLPKAREQFCMRCVRRIAEDFPDRAGMLYECCDLKAYYERYLGKC